MDLGGRVAIVTGGAAGAGRTMAQRRADEGATVVVVADVDDSAGHGSALDLSLRAPMLATQLVLEPMRRRGGGAVVNVASTGGLGLAPYESPEYGAAKAGLIRFTACMASAREDTGVRVNCAVPHWIATDRALPRRLLDAV